MSQLRSPLLGYAAVVSLTALALAACGSNSSGSTGGSNPSGGPQLVGEPRTPSRCAPTCPTSRSSSRTARQGRRLRRRPAWTSSPRSSASSRHDRRHRLRLASPRVPPSPRRSATRLRRGDHQRQAQESRELLDPYFDATAALLAKKDSASPTCRLKGKKLGVQTDTTGQDLRREGQGRQRLTTPVVFDDLPTQIAGVLSPAGSTPRSTTTAPPRLRQGQPATAVVKEFDTGEQYGFSSRRTMQRPAKIKDAFNEALKKLDQDGSYKDSYKKWFGSDPAVMPTVSVRTLP